jgi:hypothetical protein
MLSRFFEQTNFEQMIMTQIQLVFLFLLCISNPFHVIIKHLNINKRLILFILLYLLTFKSKFLVFLYFFFRLPLYFVTETNNNRKWKKKSAKMHSVKNVL